jgi:hypothetical protein
MLVLIDRPQGGSGYQDGRIELMINRYGDTNDNLGVWEAMKDLDNQGNTLNVSGTYRLYFGSSTKEA